VNRQILLARRGARTRAAVLAGNLGSDIKHVLDMDAAAGGAASAVYRRVRATADDLDKALSFGLDFDFAPDDDLGRMRGHARNLVLVIRSNVRAVMSSGVEKVLPDRHLLRQAGRFAQELTATVESIQRRVLEIEASTPQDPWSATWAGRLLALAAQLLPPDRRRDFIEDQCANLEMAVSRREWARYMLGLLVGMPEIAHATLVRGDREYRQR